MPMHSPERLAGQGQCMQICLRSLHEHVNYSDSYQDYAIKVLQTQEQPVTLLPCLLRTDA
jgi:hypothetical protein